MYSVVMPVWVEDHETLVLTENAVKSINESGKHQIIIIDNGSGFGRGRLRQLANIYIRNDRNRGYAKAVNQGLARARDIAAVANNDIRVSPNWHFVTRDILKDPSVGSVHFRMIPYGAEMKYGDKVFLTGRERWCTGSFFVIRNVIHFDERFLNSYDDWDIQYRLRKEGYKTAYTTKACYQHMNSFTQKRVEGREENNQRNREYFKQKHGDYAEDIWTREFPEQMTQDYYSFFNEL